VFLVGDARDDMLDGGGQSLVDGGSARAFRCRGADLQFARTGEGVAVDRQELTIGLEVFAEVAAVGGGLGAGTRDVSSARAAGRRAT